ncbi:hypothetical protein MUN82_03915 [Hymenobacter aerilatus]|uniref:Uncharacterized protein n=1 Tax=Hymenobacter aerilatus TaxID=2932251 RepID=A0A8T9SWN6_9BACT|nr:hypothetical protein [Hymenobacter aerilatus]UOR06245.1 hypothetical protein MUN82_03915 [Hymenobacter aerilatus]
MNELLLPDSDATFLVDRVAVTRCDNDLTKLDSVQSDYSTTINLPDAAPVRRALGHAEQGTSTTQLPYRKVPAVLRLGGVEVVPRGQLLTWGHTRHEGFEVQVFGGNSDFYAALGDKKLRELDLSQYDHVWSLNGILDGSLRTSAYRYELYDRGQGAPVADTALNVFEAGLWPTAYVRAVWEQIFKEAGTVWGGPMPPEFDQLVMPATEPFGYGEKVRKEHTSAAQRSGGLGTAGRVLKTSEFTHTLVYDSVAAPRYVDPGGGYNATTGVRTIQLAGYYRLKAGLRLFLRCDVGRVSGTLEVLVNGKPVAQDFVSTGSAAVGLLAEKERMLLQTGDTVTVRLSGKERTKVVVGERWEYGNSPLDDLDIFEVELLEDFPPGGLVRLQDWLPDLTQKELVKTVIGLYGLTQRTDAYSGAVLFTPTANVMPRLSTAPDWSGRIDASQSSSRSWRVGDYAQVNWFRWKEDSTTPEALKDLGSGSLLCDNTTLDATKDVLTLPFAATPTGAAGLPLVPYWKKKDAVDAAKLAEQKAIAADAKKSKLEREAARREVIALQYDTQSPQPRLLYTSANSRPVDLTDGLATLHDVALPVATFSGLDFASVLLPTFYPHLAAVLRRPLALTLSVRLSAAEVVAFEQLQPVWLEEEGSFFYVNKVAQWEADQPSSEAELLRLSE